MSGKRILDLISLASATRAVVAQHLRVRSHQWDVYSRTSSVVRPLVYRDGGRGVEKGAVGGVPVEEGGVKAEERKEEVVGNVEKVEKVEKVKNLDPEVYMLRSARGLGSAAVLGGIPGLKKKAMVEELVKHPAVKWREEVEAREREKEKGDKEMRKEEVMGKAVGSDEVVVGKGGASDVKVEEVKPRVIEDVSKANEVPAAGEERKVEKLVSGKERNDVGRKVEVVQLKEEAMKEEEILPVAPVLATPVEQPISIHQINTQTQNTTKPAIFEMSASRVPSSQISRLWHYGSLAAGMSFGALSEGIKRATVGGSSNENSIMFSEANVERLVKKLSRMRGAALKLGQMLSFQDVKMLPPAIHNILTRVQDSADYMPISQRDQTLARTLGKDWKSLFSSFTDVPIAAASIGQVHAAVLAETGLPVAVKIQYPGVKNSIDSDLNNLSLLLTASKILPKGMYLDKTIANARTELAWECDYLREAEAIETFRDLLGKTQEDRDTFTVPKVIQAASGEDVLTMEFMHGVGVTSRKLVVPLTQQEKDYIGSTILKLSLREIAEFAYMQTDPNWSNFLWNPTTKKIELLDFGASRAYPREFITLYLSLLRSAARRDREECIRTSIELGYLTGVESQAMLNAHVQSLFILAEPFVETQREELYDFSRQTVTDRVRELIPVMMRERLSPPPEETYSLHRKLSGAFLLCARLGSRVECSRIFEEVVGR